MKIGILTHYEGTMNYGGALQAYALTKYLQHEGYDAEQVRYLWGNQTFRDYIQNPPSPPAPLPPPVPKELPAWKRFFPIVVLRKIKTIIHSVFFTDPQKKWRRKNFEKRKQATEAFRNAIPHSENTYTIFDIEKVTDLYDCFITGSDQVWNFTWFNPAFFLECFSSDKKKIAYAVSAGKSSFEEDEQAYLAKILPQFDAISVREDDLVPAFSGLSGKNEVLHVMDPVFLLSKDEWKAAASPRIIKSRYLFCYFLEEDPHQWQVAEELAKAKRLRLVSIPCAAGKEDQNITPPGKSAFGVGPLEFLSLIRHADFVLTDSFHASAFSLIFDRPFATFGRTGRASMGSRIRSLLNLFGCPERFCDTGDRQTVPYCMSLPSIPKQADQTAAKEKIDASRRFLTESLGTPQKP